MSTTNSIVYSRKSQITWSLSIDGFWWTVTTVLLTHDQVAHVELCWICRSTKACLKLISFSCRIWFSTRRRSFSIFAPWQWCITYRSLFPSSRFSVLSWLSWLLKSSRYFCFFILDRLEDSRFDFFRFFSRSSFVGKKTFKPVRLEGLSSISGQGSLLWHEFVFSTAGFTSTGQTGESRWRIYLMRRPREWI